MTRHRRIRSANPIVAVSLVTLLIGIAGVSVAGARTNPAGTMARSISVRDTARLHLVDVSGSKLTERGTATGTIPGQVFAHFDVGPRVYVSFTLTARGGSIKVKGTGIPETTGIRTKFHGSVTVVGGTGRYAHAHGQGKLSGVANRRTWDVTVNVSGHLS